ncbi:MAG: fructose-6-phosphate aldolase [Solirubrobacterales bacterium]|nr:fructose-6-phosphate aldolase [Solirubrobacterales bacterium]HRV59567.1 fructose-6-phosphate aldolase [Solirubrobacterales bacterium]
MELFIDTGAVSEVEEIAAWGVLSGATTNPSLLAKEDGEPGDIIRKIADLVNGPTSAEVVSPDAEGMIAEGQALRKLHEHVTVKVPFGPEGLKATKALTDDGAMVNMTLVFSPNQALLAASAGATFVSCFMGRLDDISVDSAKVVEEICDVLRSRDLESKVLAASIRHPEHMVVAASLGCDIATVPAKVFHQMLNHPLTTEGAAKFEEDWKSRPEFGEWLSGLVAADKG